LCCRVHDPRVPEPLLYWTRQALASCAPADLPFAIGTCAGRGRHLSTAAHTLQYHTCATLHRAVPDRGVAGARPSRDHGVPPAGRPGMPHRRRLPLVSVCRLNSHPHAAQASRFGPASEMATSSRAAPQPMPGEGPAHRALAHMYAAPPTSMDPLSSAPPPHFLLALPCRDRYRETGFVLGRDEALTLAQRVSQLVHPTAIPLYPALVPSAHGMHLDGRASPRETAGKGKGKALERAGDGYAWHGPSDRSS
jgi:hypothetical protein